MPSPPSELLKARTDDIEVPDIVWIRPEVDPPRPEQDGLEGKAICEDQKRSIQFNLVEEEVQSCSLPK